MKKIIKLLILGLIIISPNVSLIAQNAKGLIIVESDGKGKNKQMAIEDA